MFNKCEHLEYFGSYSTIFLRQKGVSRTHGQTIRLTYGLTSYDLKVITQFPGHVTNNGQLLEVLLPKVSAGWSYDVEKSRHNLNHTIKMTRPIGPFHVGIQAIKVIMVYN